MIADPEETLYHAGLIYISNICMLYVCMYIKLAPKVLHVICQQTWVVTYFVLCIQCILYLEEIPNISRMALKQRKKR